METSAGRHASTNGDVGLSPALRGLMQDDVALTIHHIRQRLRIGNPQAEVVALGEDGVRTRMSYGESAERIDRLARVLTRLGVRQGDRVGTFAWNNQRHFELYFAIPCVGAVLHTLNIRLFEEQLTYIANHAEDRVIFVDASLVPALEQLAPSLQTVRHYVVMADSTDPEGAAQPVDTGSLPNALSYEELLEEA